jgi:hypothetical protein
MSRFRFVYVGRSMSIVRRQRSAIASLSTMNAQSEWLIIACVARMELKGSATGMNTYGPGGL